MAYKKKKLKYIYMAVTADKYELPICVEDSAEMVARKVGTTATTVKNTCWKYEHGYLTRARYHRVEVEHELVE